MMTPVYNVAIADWKTNNCSVNQYAARLALSAISTIRTSENEYSPLTTKHLFLCCLHYVKKHSFQCFHFSFAETAQYFHHTTEQTKRNSLLKTKSSKQDVLSNAQNHNLYSSEGTPRTDYNLAKSSTDVLWQLARLELKARKSESNVLRSYIQEQPADDTTTATDEEK